MAAAEPYNPKWEGKFTATLKATADAVWPLIEDFCSLHKYLPTIDTCHKVSGVYGQVGVVRYCGATPPDGGDVKWCNEKLVAIDPVGKWLTYEIMDNNMGMKEYMATFKVVPIDGGCQIQWSFLADPFGGLTYEEILGFLNSTLQGMAMNIEKAILMELSTD